jgi:type VI secretion system VasD/TssJ family lipoprotein
MPHPPSRRVLRVLLRVVAGPALALAALSCGPGASPVSTPVQVQYPPPPTWPFSPGAVVVHYRADKGLNTYEDRPHALLMVVYQLSAVNAFNDLAKDQTGLQTLLESGYFDQSVASIEKVYVQPGEEKDLAIDRAQGAKWVGVVTGYYQQVPGKTSSLMPIPFEQDVVRRMRLRLMLGKDSIHFVESTKETERKP